MAPAVNLTPALPGKAAKRPVKGRITLPELSHVQQMQNFWGAWHRDHDSYAVNPVFWKTAEVE